jgi:hypothetical protein
MPRVNDNRYKTVSKLPDNAIKVSEYAKLRGCADHSLIYHWITRGKANYSIVIFQGINFVIPD